MPTIVEQYRAAVEENPLRQWRTEHGISINECAALLGVTPITVSKWERGTQPSTENLWRIGKLIQGGDNPTNIQNTWQEWREKLPSYE